MLTVLKRSSCPRVRLLVNLLQPLDGGVGVDLGRRDRRVAEQLLDGAEIGAAIEEVRREAVAERVRRRAAADAGLERALVDDAAERARRQAAY